MKTCQRKPQLGAGMKERIIRQAVISFGGTFFSFLFGWFVIAPWIRSL